MIRTIIIDDENSNTAVLKGLLNEYCPQVQVLKTFASVTESVPFISDEKPSLVFLDVELGNETGFKLFDFFPSPEFQVIFTTAHEKYALNAIKTSCLEYLLKPIDHRELTQAVAKFEKQHQLTVSQKKVETLLENLKNASIPFNKIAIPTKDSYTFININDIICCEASGGYSIVYTTNNDKLISIKNLKEFEEIFNPKQFFRCHKSWLINLQFIKKFLKTDSQILMSNDMLIDLAVRKKEEFVSLFEKF